LCPNKNNYLLPVQVAGVGVRGIYLKITGNSNGVDTMDKIIGQKYQNTMHQTGRTVDTLTCPGALC